MSAPWLRLIPPALRARLEGRYALHAVIGNSGWLLFDKLVRAVLGLLVGVWVARYLGPTRFGELAYVLAFIAFFQAVANLGADGIIVRDIAQDRAAASRILGTAFVLRFCVGVACWIAAIAIVALMNGVNDPSVALTALAGGVLVFQAADTVDLWFQSQSQSRRTVVAKLTAYLLSSGAKIVLILTGAPLAAFAAMTAAESAAGALGLCLAYSRFPTDCRWELVQKQARQLVRDSWPFMLSGISIMVYMRIDQIMIKEILGERELGLYAAALPFSQVWQVIPMVLAISLAPVIARKKTEGESEYQNALLTVFRVFGVVSLCVSVATALASSTLIPLLYGQNYSGAAPILAIHAFSNIFVFQGVAQSLWLTNERAGRLSLLKTLLGGIAAVGANLILLPMLGAVGAAVSANISFGIAAVFSNILYAPRIFLMQLGIRPRAR
jgi:PST family polysaccharide transporter